MTSKGPAQSAREMLDGLAEYEARGFGVGRFDIKPLRPILESAIEAEGLRAEVERLTKERDAALDDRDAAHFAHRNGKSLAEDSIHAIRELLNASGVPLAAFIDDHVGNAVAQRDEARADNARLQGVIATMGEALEPFAGKTLPSSHPRTIEIVTLDSGERIAMNAMDRARYAAECAARRARTARRAG